MGQIDYDQIYYLQGRVNAKIISLLGKANKRMISPSSGKASPVTTRVFKRR